MLTKQVESVPYRRRGAALLPRFFLLFLHCREFLYFPPSSWMCTLGSSSNRITHSTRRSSNVRCSVLRSTGRYLAPFGRQNIFKNTWKTTRTFFCPSTFIELSCSKRRANLEKSPFSVKKRTTAISECKLLAKTNTEMNVRGACQSKKANHTLLFQFTADR